MLRSPAIHIQDLSLRFADGTELFDGLSFKAEGGLCTCLLGPSGCGKSSLLRLISGARGFSVQGSVSSSPPITDQAGYAWMGQDDLLLPWLNLLDNVLLGPKLRGEIKARHRNRAMALLAEAGLSGYETMLPAALSGGMRQRGALLRTLMEKRPVLLMDEPFSALDALTRLKLQNICAEMTRGKTVLLVTHDPMEALRLADVIIVLGGAPASVQMKITLDGPVPRALDSPEISDHYGSLTTTLMEERYQ